MKNLQAMMEMLGITEEEAMQAVLSAVAPLHPGVARQNWNRLSTFGNSSPSTAEIWSKVEAADFRCEICKSQLRITLDHNDGNSTNHSLDNLRVLCFACNRAKASKSVKNHGASMKVFLEVLSRWVAREPFPVIRNAPPYLLRYLRKRFGGGWNRTEY